MGPKKSEFPFALFYLVVINIIKIFFNVAETAFIYLIYKRFKSQQTLTTNVLK